MPIKRRSIPKFSLVNSTTISVKRPGVPIKIYGRVEEGVPSFHTIEGNLQPLKPNELMVLTETDRTKEWIKVYTDPSQDIRTAREGDDGWEADFVVWNDLEYKVMKIKEYSMGVLDHIMVYAARIPISAGIL